MLFFFKQKTAYEMRISDWSSDVCSSDLVCATFGEAKDMADKATNKAMSAAYKDAAFMTFAIPVEGEEDADAVTPEPTVRKPVVQKLAPREKAKGPIDQTNGALNTSSVMTDLLKAMWRSSSIQELAKWHKNNAVMIEELTADERDTLRNEYRKCSEALETVARVAA